MWYLQSVVSIKHIFFFLSVRHLIGKPFVCRNYWRDYDTALFIMRHLYRGIDEDNLPAESSRKNSKDKMGFPGWSDQIGTVDEELPLTFSERSMTRIFSKKYKKVLSVLSCNTTFSFHVLQDEDYSGEPFFVTHCQSMQSKAIPASARIDG